MKDYIIRALDRLDGEGIRFLFLMVRGLLGE